MAAFSSLSQTGSCELFLSNNAAVPVGHDTPTSVGPEQVGWRYQWNISKCDAGRSLACFSPPWGSCYLSGQELGEETRTHRAA